MTISGNYFLKSGYRSREKPKQFDDSEEDALTYQLDVYSFAGKLARDLELESVLDLGCGLALKLRKYLQPAMREVFGVDQEHSITYCQKNHDFGTWIVDNLEQPVKLPKRNFDLIISADVIEHLVDPDNLLNLIKQCTHPQTRIVISTPERDLRRGADDMGPPANAAHVREWNRDELSRYIQSHGFEILEHCIMNLKAGMPTCQTLLCRFGQETNRFVQQSRPR